MSSAAIFIQRHSALSVSLFALSLVSVGFIFVDKIPWTALTLSFLEFCGAGGQVPICVGERMTC